MDQKDFWARDELSQKRQRRRVNQMDEGTAGAGSGSGGAGCGGGGGGWGAGGG